MEIQEELIAEKTHAFNQDIQMSFTEFLKGEFVKKVKFNSSFSLRSYARFLDIHFATLSHLMSGKRIATERTILKIAPRLNATEEEVQGWLETAKMTKSGTQEFGILEGPQGDDLNMRLLEKENLALLSEWYHDAIVELVHTKSFRKDVAWIARVFGISHIEASEAVNRLFKVGLLQLDSEENWIVVDQYKTTITKGLNTSKALRMYQSSLLQKSLESIEIVPIEERTHSSLIVAMSKEQLLEVREEIAKLRRKINQMTSVEAANGGAESVYCFCFSGFPLTDF